METLGGNYSRAFGINDSGQVVGKLMGGFTNVVEHAFLYSAGAIEDFAARVPWRFTQANAINQGGQVVGEAWADGGGASAFLYSSGQFYLFDASDRANSINDFGQIVGREGYRGTWATGSFGWSAPTCPTARPRVSGVTRPCPGQV